MKPTEITVDEEEEESESGLKNLDENLLYEILKHADARTLGTSACVSKLWNKTAQDERLWEPICIRNWPSLRIPPIQLRSVVTALGGFQRFYSINIRPLLNSSSSASSSVPRFQKVCSKPQPKAHWGKDGFNLSLSLYSIRCFEKIKPP